MSQSVSFAARSTERAFLWNEANAIMAAAKSPQDFLRAAQTYQKLVDQRVYNSSVFFNLGTALLNAERYEDALAAFLRAERYGGSMPDITRNMQIARAKKENRNVPTVPWGRFILFWHYRLPCSTRTAIALIGFTTLWIGLTFRALGWRRIARPLVLLALITTALFGSSVVTSMHQEGNAKRPVFDRPAP